MGALYSEDKQILQCLKPEGHTQCESSLKAAGFIVIGGKIGSVVAFPTFIALHVKTPQAVYNTQNKVNIQVLK